MNDLYNENKTRDKIQNKKSLVLNSSEINTSDTDDEDDEIYIDMLDHDYQTTFEPFNNMTTPSEMMAPPESTTQIEYKKASNPTIDALEKTTIKTAAQKEARRQQFKPYYTYDDYKEDISLNANELNLRPQEMAQKKMDASRNILLERVIQNINPTRKVADNMRKMTTNFNATTFREFMKSVVNYVPESVDYYLYYVCYKFANAFYKIEGAEINTYYDLLNKDITYKNAKDEKVKDKLKETADLNADADVLKKLAYGLVCLPFALYIAYNWWFLFNKTGVYIDFAKILEKISPLNFFFECTIQPTNIVNYLLLGLKDEDLSQSFFKSSGDFLVQFRGIAFLMLLGLSYYISYNYSGYFNKTLNDVIDSKKNTLYSLAFSIVIISFLFKDVFSMDRLFKMSSILGNPIFVLIALLIKFLFVMITVPFSLPFVFLFLIVFSFGGIIMNKGIGELWNTMKIIDYEIENSFPDPEKNNCFEAGSLSEILHYINKYFFKYLLPILSSVISLVGIKNSGQIKSQSLQLLVLTFYGFALFLSGVGAYMK